jgi:hypothetical protein
VGPDNRGQVGDSFLAELCTRSSFPGLQLDLPGGLLLVAANSLRLETTARAGLAFGRSAIPASSLRSSRREVASAQVGSICVRRGSELLFGFLCATGLGR